MDYAVTKEMKAALNPLVKSSSTKSEGKIEILKVRRLNALSHCAIFHATCDAILLLGGLKLANTCFHHSLPKYF